MKSEEILEKLRSVFTKNAGVEMCFGKPMEVNELSIIPVARVSFGMGFGAGSSPKKGKKATDTGLSEDQETPITEENQANEGAGGGGGMQTSPVGIYTLKNGKVMFYPVIGIKEILALLTIVFLFSLRLGKSCKKRAK